MSRVGFRLRGTDEDSSEKTADCSKRRNHKVGLSVVHGLSFFFRGNETVDFVSDFFDGFIGRLWRFQLPNVNIETKLGIGVGRMIHFPIFLETLSLLLVFGPFLGAVEKVNKNEVVSDFILFGSPKFDGLSEEDSILFWPPLPNIRKFFGGFRDHFLFHAESFPFGIVFGVLAEEVEAGERITQIQSV